MSVLAFRFEESKLVPIVIDWASLGIRTQTGDIDISINTVVGSCDFGLTNSDW